MALLFAAFLLVTLFFNIIGVSLERLGLSQSAAFFILMAALLGSSVNIPIYRRRIAVTANEPLSIPWFFYRPPVLRQQVIAINVGGALIPLGLVIYLAGRVPIGPLVLVTVLVTIVCKLLARPNPGLGISLPPFIPPLTAAGLALLFAGHAAAPVAFISGVVGTLVGADLLNLPAVLAMPGGVMSIGGAGVFDGIFLVGMIAVLLT